MDQAVITTRSGSSRSKKEKKKKNKNNKGSEHQSQGPPSAVSNAPQNYHEERTKLSRSQSDQLPVNEINNQPSDSVSESLNSVVPQSILINTSSQMNPSLSHSVSSCTSQCDGSKGKNSDSVESEKAPPETPATQVSDNQSIGGLDVLCQCGAPTMGDQAVLKLVLEELKDLKSQMAKVVSIESNTESLTKQLIEVSNRTSEIDEAITSNSARLREVNDEITTIKTFVGKQESSINSLKNFKNEVAATTSKAVAQMNSLVEEQQSQVESFKSCTKVLKKDILCEVEKSCQRIVREEMEQIKKDILVEAGESCQKTVKEEVQQVEKIVKEEVQQVKAQVNSIASEAYCNRFKNQAYNNRFNLLIVGLAEDGEKGTRELVQEFFSQALNTKKAGVKVAFRIGPKPAEVSQYIRPIVVKFYSVEQRNEIWKNRTNITGENDTQTIRIQADVPKPLREGVKLMYKIVRAAASAKVYGEARVRNYQLELNDKIFQFSELEKLPYPLRPSTLASPRSEEALAFFTSSSVLSNHHPSVFTVGDMTYLSMEQFLAYKKAETLGNKELMDKACKAKNPVQAKYILNQLKSDNEKDWDEKVENITVEGLKAKFQQNSDMYTFLYNTSGLMLGEASKNPRWGIGLELTDENVLDHTKWSASGNLLGRALMKVREAICTPRPAENNQQ